MFAVIFEVQPRPGAGDAYLRLASELRPHLETIDGFLSVERFTSLRRPDWMLSLSFWRDEAALVRWRTFERHHEVQAQARASIFTDYRLRVGQVVVDLRRGETTQPDRRSAYNDPTTHVPSFTTILEVESTVPGERMMRQAEEAATYQGFVSMERFASIYTPGKHLVLTAWRNESGAMAFHHHVTSDLQNAQQGGHWYVIEIERDYGMFVRQEAPQYFPPVESETAGGTSASSDSKQEA